MTIVVEAEWAAPSVSGTVPEFGCAVTGVNIQYTLANTYNANVEIIIKDAEGNTVRSYFLTDRSVGTHTVGWDGAYSNGTIVPDGIYTVDLNVNSGTIPEIRDPVCVEVDRNGTVYVGDYLKNVKIYRFGGITPTASLLDDAYNPYPSSIAVNSTGYVFVADADNEVVRIYAPNTSTSCAIIRGMYFPASIDIDKLDNLYVATRFGDRGHTTSGNITVYSAGSTAPHYTIWDFPSPEGVAVDGNLALYVTNSSETVFLMSGDYTNAIITGLHYPTGVDVDYGQNVYVSCSFSDEAVYKYSPGGIHLLETFTGFSRPDGFSVDRDGNVYVASQDDHKVFIFYSDVSASAGSVLIDNVAPGVNCSLNGSILSGWYISNVTVSLSADDAASGVGSLKYSLDNVSWSEYSTPFNVSTNGTNIVYFNCTDNAGNRVYGNRSFQVDRAPPVSGIPALTGTPGANGWYVSNVTIGLSASDILSGIATINYSVNGGAWHSVPGPSASFAVLSGVNDILYNAVDTAGNSESVHTLAVNVDTSSPISDAPVMIGASGANGWYLSNVTVSLNATDSVSGVAGISYSVNGDAMRSIAGGNASLIVSHGINTIDYYATDNASNNGSYHTVVVKVDTLSPVSGTPTLTGTSGDNGWDLSNVTVGLSASDSTSGVAMIDYTVNGGPVHSIASIAGSFVVTEGVNTIQYNAVDAAGNTDDLHTLIVKVDTSSPVSDTPSLSGAPGTNGWYLTNVTVGLTASDATSDVAGINYTLNGGAWQPASAGGISFVVSEGANTIQYYATDIAGNTESIQTLMVNVDLLAPVTTFSQSSASSMSGWSTSNVTVRLSSVDSPSGVNFTSYSIDGNAWVDYTGRFNVTENGNHTLDYRSTDMAGNVEPIKTAWVKVDKYGALFSWNLSGSRSPGGAFTSDVVVDFTPAIGTGLTNIQFSLDGSNWYLYWNPINVPHGTSPVFYRFFDPMGNLLSGTITLCFSGSGYVATPTPTVTPTPTPVTSPTPTVTPVPCPSPSGPATPSTAPSPAPNTDNSLPLLLILGGAAVLGVIGMGAYFLLFRK